MEISLFISKVRRRIRGSFVKYACKEKYYSFFYKSYWHFIFSTNKETNNVQQYFSTYPNSGAGIGHQMANWISGYWWAKQFEKQYAYIPFPSSEWDAFLGFGLNEVKVDDLVEQGYKKVSLPMFDEFSRKAIEQTKKIIDSYSNRKVIFIAEQDQGFKDHYKIMDDLKQKFYSNPARKSDTLCYSKANYNIAIHVRRGDIVANKDRNENLNLRWQDNSYFVKVLQNVIQTIKTDKPIQIHLFSQGERADFKDFEQFENIHFCLDISTQDSFLNMIYADLLITSKSSFSYKPALINNGIKVCPADFWLGYPEQNDWIIADSKGNFDAEKLKLNL